MADLVLAQRGISLRRRSSGAPLTLDPSLEIGAGGEARVLGVPGWPFLVAKLYREPTLDRARKLAVMMERPPQVVDGASLAWPLDLLTDFDGRRFAGFLMPRAEGPRIFEFYNPVARRREAPHADWALLHRAGASLAAAFDGLHAHGYVVGDVNESNILVAPADGTVTLVDADSFQVRDPVTRAVFRSRVGKAEFTPPELQGVRFGEVDRAPEHDRFGLAVLLFLLLMEGTHPFASRFENDGEALPVEDRIRRGMFPHAPDARGCRPPRMAPPFFALDPALQALFLRAFVDGGRDPAARPTAAEWRTAMEAAGGALQTCAANPRHRHVAGVPYCPWCHRAKLLQGRDPFPATLDEARATDAAPLLRRVQRPQPAFAPAQPPVPHAAFPPVNIAPTATVPTGGMVFLTSLRAAVPAWAQPAFGPAALGNPLVWMPPAALTCLFGASGGVRVLGMAVFFLALRQVFGGAVTRVRAATAGWALALILVWMFFSGVLGGVPFAPADTPAPQVSADVPDAAAAPLPSMLSRDAPVAAGGSGDAAGDQPASTAQPSPPAAPILPPELTNAREMDEVIRQAHPGGGDAYEAGDAEIRFFVEKTGEVDPKSVIAVGASSAAFGRAAQSVAWRMHFRPAMQDGAPIAQWVTVPVHFDAPRQ